MAKQIFVKENCVGLAYPANYGALARFMCRLQVQSGFGLVGFVSISDRARLSTTRSSVIFARNLELDWSILDLSLPYRWNYRARMRRRLVSVLPFVVSLAVFDNKSAIKADMTLNWYDVVLLKVWLIFFSTWMSIYFVFFYFCTNISLHQSNFLNLMHFSITAIII